MPIGSCVFVDVIVDVVAVVKHAVMINKDQLERQGLRQQLLKTIVLFFFSSEPFNQFFPFLSEGLQME